MTCEPHRVPLISLRRLGLAHFPYLGLSDWGLRSADAESFVGNHRRRHAAAAAEDGKDAAGLAMAGNGAATACLIGILDEILGETSLAA